MIFTTKNLHIRPIKESEYKELLKFYCHENNMKYIQNGKFDWTLEEVKQKWINEQNIGNIWSVVIRLSDQKIIGEAGLIKTRETTDREMEIGYLLDENYWGQGFGTEVCKGLMKYCFQELELKCIKAGLFKKNIRSSKLLKKAGFKLYKEFTTLTNIDVELYEYPAPRNTLEESTPN